MIKFGTDGWRAIMADQFTFANVRIVVQAIASYVADQGMASRGMVIGYDNRFLSEQFAQVAAEVLTANGIAVWLPDKAMATPVTAFAIKHLKAAGAIMLTASHNPPEYNGIKFIPEYAGPALPYITDVIEANVKRVLEGDSPRVLAFADAEKQGMVRPLDVTKPYLDQLQKVIQGEKIRQAGLRIVVDPMFGAGIGYLDRFLADAGCTVETIQGYRDPLFGGSMPEPSAKVLTKLRERILETGADLGLALDGDGDRFGIIDGDGTYLTPNQVLTLLLYHLVKTRGWQGSVARTAATTHMVDRIAVQLGVAVEETPVGFKYIGEAMLHRNAFLGGEESGGLSIRGHLPEKDGILACALMAEVRAVEGKPLVQVLQSLYDEFGQLYSERLDIHTSQDEKDRVLAFIQGWHPEELAGQLVVSRQTVDGVKFNLANGSYALVRASGTEPLFRIYVEANSLEEIRSIQQAMTQGLKL
jgi:alpha-D-glucose phosphate-specific phosphoglucomutase